MPPRYSYWTIIAGGLPTAFRAADRDELLPTFTRIRHKHPDAQMKWFARGKLWDSPESARRDTEERRQGKRPPESGARNARGRDWRPGGEHRDPRQKYKEAKKARNTLERKRKFERRHRFADAGEHREREGQARPRGQSKWDNNGVQNRWNPAQRSAGPGQRSAGPGQRSAGPQERSAGPGQRSRAAPREFEKKSFGRNQRRDEPSAPPRPAPPEREPRPREGAEPTPPPRPTEPAIPAPGPPERGRVNRKQQRRRQ